jgi:hypothetical protein
MTIIEMVPESGAGHPAESSAEEGDGRANPAIVLCARSDRQLLV